jgi:hypothetical protein
MTNVIIIIKVTMMLMIVIVSIIRIIIVTIVQCQPMKLPILGLSCVWLLRCTVSLHYPTLYTMMMMMIIIIIAHLQFPPLQCQPLHPSGGRGGVA